MSGGRGGQRACGSSAPGWSLPGAVSFNDALAAGRGQTFNKPKLSPGDVAFLQYTGGTTGVSKGATLVHRNIVANVLQNDAWLQPAMAAPPHVDQLAPCGGEGLGIARDAVSKAAQRAAQNQPAQA